MEQGANSWAAIADACSKTRPLQRLVFKDCAFRDGQGLLAFARALTAAEVQSLEFINTPLGDEFVGGLVEGALLGNEKFASLRLAGCGLGDAAANRLAKALEGVGMMCSLRLLDLSHNRIGDAGACALASMLGGDASGVPLNTLELEANQITDVGGVALCRAAKAALMLQRLNLSLNPGLGPATMNALAEAVRFNAGTLREVALAGCRAGEDAAVALLRAAGKNATLQLLDIRGVPLALEGIGNLCQLLRYTTSLTTLRVDVASADGAEAIARDLPSNRSLMHITLGGPVPDGLLAAMSETLAANTVRRMNGSPAARSPHIHAWIEDSTNAYQHLAGGGRPGQAQAAYPGVYAGQPQPGHAAGATHLTHQYAPQQYTAHQQAGARSNPSSPIPQPPAPEYTRSPRSEAGGSVYSHATHRTARTHRTQRTSTSYLSFGGFTDMSRRTIMVGTTRLRMSASLAAGGAAERAAVIFRKHDQNEDNHLNKQEMLAALEEMGVLAGIKAKHVGRFLDSEFKKADWDKDGRVSLQDFISYYEKIAYYQAQMAREGRIKSMVNLNKQMVPQGVEHNAHLKSVFKNYARLAIGQGRLYTDGLPQMNSAQFQRLCLDAGFLEPEGRLSMTAVDVIFTRYRAANSRRMGFKDFIAALAAVAYEMGFQFDDIMEALGANRVQQPVVQEQQRVSEGGDVQYIHTQQQQPAQGAPLSGDPSFDVLGVPLATVHEGAEGKKGAAAKAKTSKKATGTRASATTVRSSHTGPTRANGPGAMNTNPLYESQDYSAGGPAHSSFAVTGAGGAQARSRGTVGSSMSPGRNGAPVPHAAVQPADLSVLETRLRQDLDVTVRQLEERLERQVASVRSAASAAAGNTSLHTTSVPASTDALLGAKLRQLEGQVSGLASRQDETDRVAQQLSSLKDILNRVAEEMLRIKNKADAAASKADTAVAAATAAASAGGSTSGDAAAAAAAATAVVEEKLGGVKERVEMVGRDVGSLSTQVETLFSQFAEARSAQQQHIATISALQQQFAALTAEVAALPKGAGGAEGSAAADVAATAQAAAAQVDALEKKVLNRLSRYDGALLQVAKQVDALDSRLREEQESMGQLFMMVATAGGSAAAGAGGGPSGAPDATPQTSGGPSS
ncbi:hypothetical protein GPECTOR_8g95 [Gonium pectorale]|uniref:EF-hand domain-containing protein n=1 Tax=Gonium pectorale TaxID=33097 RepID=A0A150GTC2_GONPE|nr:hypothetical protein GPECTOR_8g95 [Gonium pectorale]|eukprot:KXZ53105.1 hypothetical protein GPECTOR_8g95 [Gonium pectorale]